MVDITKLDMTKLWAASGDKVEPADEQIASGWLVQQIPRQTWNWFENRQDQNIAYMLQKGIPEWDATTEYRATKSYIQRDGVVYKCATTNTGVDPSTGTSHWVKAFPESSVALEALRNITPAANTMPYFTSGSVGSVTNLTPFARTILDDADAAAVRTTINAQVAHVNLTTLSSAGVVAEANALPYFTGSNTAATTLLTSIGRDVIGQADAAGVRSIIGLGDSATRNVGSNAGTVAAGNDSRIVNALQKTNDLSDVNSAPNARNNLGLGSSAVLNVTTSNTDATANRVMKTGDWGLGSTVLPAVSESDLNNTTRASGTYFVLTESLGTLPLAASGFLFHSANSSGANTLNQVYRPSTSSRVFHRRYIAGSWTSWTEDWSKANTSADVQAILGASNYAAVKSLLGVSNKAEAGANSDITSLTGLTTPLSASQGGTGVTSNTGTGANVLNNSPTFIGVPLAPTAAFGANSTQIATTAFVQANASAMPTGAMLHYAGPIATAPAGFLFCNGAAVSRTTYNLLFTAIGTTYGAGDGSTTFNIPDARGVFLRGLDNGRGLDPSRALGTFQSSANLSHTHTGSTSSDSHNHTVTGTATAVADHVHTDTGYNSGGVVGAAITPATGPANGASPRVITSDPAGAHSHTVTGSTSTDAHTHTFTTGASGADESRPDNIAVNMYIKF